MAQKWNTGAQAGCAGKAGSEPVCQAEGLTHEARL